MKPEWAVSKVIRFVPASNEKNTLVALAKHAHDDGWSIFCSEKLLAQETGHSVRTIRRHLRNLEGRGELVTFEQWYQGRRTNEYVIPICEPTVEELEQITGVSRRQLKLPLVQRDQSATVAVDISTEEQLRACGVKRKCPPMADKLTANGGQVDRQTPLNSQLTNKDQIFSKRKGDKMNFYKKTHAEEDKKTFAEGHSRGGLDILKEISPDVYEQIVGLSKGKAVDIVLNQQSEDAERKRRKEAIDQAYLAVAREKGFETVVEYRAWLAQGPFAATAAALEGVGEG